MNLKWRKIHPWVILMVILAIVLPACGAGNTSPTLTPVGIEAIYTSAAQTFVAQLTGTAAALPPATPTLTATATTTATLAATATQTQAAGTVPTSGNSGAVGCNNSLFITDVTIPDKQVVAPGQAFTKTWRVQNTGSCAWNSNYKLTFLSGDGMSGAATAISQTVNVNATADISVSLIAPSSPQTYTGYWKLATDTGQAFGTSMYVQISVSGASVTPGTPGTGTVTALPSATPTFGPVGCYNSAFISETIPDGTNINPGQAFTKTWVVKNTGTCEWADDFKLVFISNPMGSDTFKIRRKVAVNATTEFAVDMVAPTSPGTYTGIWRLSTDDGQMFGTSFTVRIVVSGATFTPTTTLPTNTVTPTVVVPTNTPTPTKTPAIPVTGTPTETVTPTPPAGAVSY